MSIIATHKQILRSKMRALLKAMPEQQKMGAGEMVAMHIAAWLPSFFNKNSISIAFFKSLPDEINTEPLNCLLTNLSAHRYVPHITQENLLVFVSLTDGRKAVDADWDAIFVPGLAFDKMGHRLGRGKGYYDRALAHIKRKNKTTPLFIGLALDEQIVTEIPCDDHDVPMDYLCTPALGMWHILR